MHATSSLMKTGKLNPRTGQKMQPYVSSGALIACLLLTTAAIGWAAPASALTCPSYTYTFSNGTTADATEVNANFATIANCANTLLAPLDGPAFTTSLV